MRRAYAILIFAIMAFSTISFIRIASGEWWNIPSGFEVSSTIYSIKISNPSPIAGEYKYDKQMVVEDFDNHKVPQLVIKDGGVADVSGTSIGNTIYRSGDKIVLSYGDTKFNVYIQVASLEIQIECLPQPKAKGDSQELDSWKRTGTKKAGDDNYIDWSFPKPNLDITQYPIEGSVYIRIRVSRKNAGVLAVYLERKKVEYEYIYGASKAIFSDPNDLTSLHTLVERIKYTNDYDGDIAGQWRDPLKEISLGVFPEWMDWYHKNGFGDKIPKIDDSWGDDEMYHEDWVRYSSELGGDIYLSEDALVSMLSRGKKNIPSATKIDNSSIRDIEAFFAQRRDILIEIPFKMSPALWVKFVRHWKQYAKWEGFSYNYYETWEEHIETILTALMRAKFTFVILLARYEKENEPLSTERQFPSNMSGGTYSYAWNRSYLLDAFSSVKGSSTLVLYFALALIIVGIVVIIINKFKKQARTIIVPMSRVVL